MENRKEESFIEWLGKRKCLNEGHINGERISKTLEKTYKKYKKGFKTECCVIASTEKGTSDYLMTCTGKVMSETDIGKTYNITITFHRKNLWSPFTMKDITTMRCQCPSYRGTFANTNSKKKLNRGRLYGYEKIDSHLHNPRQYTGGCKHIQVYLQYLRDKRVIA